MVNVLFVDSSTEGPNRISEALRGADITIACSSALSARQRLAETRPDVIVMDFGLPPQAGFELCRHLEMRPETRHIPVFFVGTAAEIRSARGTSDRLFGMDKLEELASRVAEVSERARIERSVREAVRAAMDASSDVTMPLGDDEQDALHAAGLDLNAPLDAAPIVRHANEYRDILDKSLTVRQAMAWMGVSDARVRQRLGPNLRTLYGIREGRQWRIPEFQFREQSLVPGIGEVVSRLGRELDPVPVVRWFRKPNHDLETEGGIISPLAWLSRGRKPSVVAELAEDLGPNR